MSNAPTRLFCFSGGGLAGLDIHAGMWEALDDIGIVATECAGTSAGAFAAAFCCMDWPGWKFAELVKSLADEDVKRRRFLWKLRFPWLDSIYDPTPIRALLERHLDRRFETLKKPCRIMATDETARCGHEFFEGDLIPAILASMAVSGFWPPVNMLVDEKWRRFSDGGTSAHLPLPANWTDFDEVYLLVASPPVEFSGRGIIGRLRQNIDMLIEDQLCDAITVATNVHSCVRVLRPSMRLRRGSFHFDHHLAMEAYHWTRGVTEREGWES